jgi:hypothetical protein
LKEILKILNNNNGVSIPIASGATSFSAIAVVVALCYNAKTQNQYKKSLEPQLNIRMDKYNGMLYLLVQNIG